MTNLSAAAQEVFWAYNREASGKPDDHHMLEAIAAALREAALRLSVWSATESGEGQYLINQDDLFAIAAELEEFAIR
jgi:hypothetical protein